MKVNPRNPSKYAKEQGISPQLMRQRILGGYLYGILDGQVVMYQPKSVFHVKGDTRAIKAELLEVQSNENK